MDIRDLLVAIFWLALAPLAEPAAVPGTARSLEAGSAVPPLTFERARAAMPVIAQEWRRTRVRAHELVCDLGIIAIALVECPEWALLDESTPAAVDLPAPDFEDIERRSVEERMRSI